MLLSILPALSPSALAPESQLAAAAAVTMPAGASAENEADPSQAQLQIGDFTLGDIDCPSLTGHPDIRY